MQKIKKVIKRAVGVPAVKKVYAKKQMKRRKPVNSQLKIKKTCFIPLCDIPVIKFNFIGFNMGTLAKGLDYYADNFIQSRGMTFFTLNDEEGWIADYAVQTSEFLVEYN